MYFKKKKIKRNFIISKLNSNYQKEKKKIYKIIVN